MENLVFESSMQQQTERSRYVNRLSDFDGCSRNLKNSQPTRSMLKNCATNKSQCRVNEVANKCSLKCQSGNCVRKKRERERKGERYKELQRMQGAKISGEKSYTELQRDGEQRVKSVVLHLRIFSKYHRVCASYSFHDSVTHRRSFLI